MTDYLHNLIGRARQTVPVLQPRTPGWFEPHSTAPVEALTSVMQTVATTPAFSPTAPQSINRQPVVLEKAVPTPTAYAKTPRPPAEEQTNLIPDPTTDDPSLTAVVMKAGAASGQPGVRHEAQTAGAFAPFWESATLKATAVIAPPIQHSAQPPSSAPPRQPPSTSALGAAAATGLKRLPEELNQQSDPAAPIVNGQYDTKIEQIPVANHSVAVHVKATNLSSVIIDKQRPVQAATTEPTTPEWSHQTAAVSPRNVERTVTAVTMPKLPHSPVKNETPAVVKPAPVPTIDVKIGRIEVRAVPPAPARKQQRSASPVMGLDDYLRRNHGDGQ